MCLEINNIKRSKGRTLFRRTYWKVLRIKPYGYYNTLYNRMKIEFGKTYEIEDKEFNIEPGLYSEYKLEGGAFHLFKNRKDADEVAWDKDSPHDNMLVVKAIVPAGTQYIKGKYLGYDSLAVKKVRYEKNLDKRRWKR